MAEWYRTGTVTVTNGSLAVTGTTTGWSDSTVKEGDALFVPASSSYPGEISTVNSATSITLDTAWHGTTQAGAVYFIFKGMEWGDVTSLATQISALIASQTEVLAGTGVPSSGLGSDGSVYFRQDVPEYYAKVAGSWGTAISLTGPTGPTGALSTGTSTTSVAIGTGSKTFTTQASRAWVVGTRLRVASSANPTTAYMEGVITSYSSTTVILTVDRTAGSGTLASWNLGIAGDVGSTGSTGASYSATSTTSLAIATGSKAFTTQAGLAYVVGQRARAANTADTANFMEGRITAYSGTTLTILVDLIGGSGTLASWNIGIAGQQGIQGIQGPDGPVGADGPTGPSYAATSTTSMTIGVGSQAFTTQSGLAYSVGASRVRVSDTAGTNYMEGLVTAYSGTSMTVAFDRAIGAGTLASWVLSLAGDVGGDGADGVSFVFSSAYSAATAYALNDVVTDQNSSWICIQAGTGNAPPTLPTTSNAYWEALAVAGVDGDGAVNTVNGVASVGGDVTLAATDIEISALVPANYTPLGTSIEQHLAGISDALATTGRNPNILYNGDGAINQRFATTAADDAYHFDRWYALTQTAAIGTSQVVDAENGVPSLIRLTQSNATAQRMGSAQIVEALESVKCRGSAMTLSGKVRMSTSATVRFAILEWTATANVVTSDVVLSWTSATFTAGNFFLASNVTVAGTGSLALTANTLTDFEMTATLSSSCDNIIVMIWTDATAAQTVTLDYRAKLEGSATATAWVSRPYAEELKLCRRYLFPIADGRIDGSEVVMPVWGMRRGTNAISVPIGFDQMRGNTPTLVTSSPTFVASATSGNEVAAYNYEAVAFTTITGSLASSLTYHSPQSLFFSLTATTFGGTAGQMVLVLVGLSAYFHLDNEL